MENKARLVKLFYERQDKQNWKKRWTSVSTVRLIFSQPTLAVPAGLMIECKFFFFHYLHVGPLLTLCRVFFFLNPFSDSTETKSRRPATAM